MKNFKRTAVFSILVIAFTLVATSCGKQNLKKDLDGSWTLNNITQNGVDVWAQSGGSVSGTYFFNKRAKKCTISTTVSWPPNPDESSSSTATYKVIDKETIKLDEQTYTVVELTGNTLVLSFTSDGVVYNINFTK